MMQHEMQSHDMSHYTVGYFSRNAYMSEILEETVADGHTRLLYGEGIAVLYEIDVSEPQKTGTIGTKLLHGDVS